MLLLQLLLNGLVTAGIYSLLAVGFGMVYRSLKFFHMAYGAIYTAGAYILYVLYCKFGIPLAIAIPFSIVLSGLLGVIVDLIAYLPLEKKGATAGVLFIASLGIYIAIVNLIALLFGNEVKVILEGIQPSFSIGSLVLTRLQVVQFFVGWGTVLVFWLGIRRNITIKALWAMGEAPSLLKVLGFSWKKLRICAFGTSSVMASLASILVALDIGVDPHVGMHAILTGAVAVLVGGMERYWGWIGGAFLLSILQSLVIWKISSQWQDALTFVILIFTLLFKPQGLFSPAKRMEER